MPKFPVGPTSSRPGPILLKVAATAVKIRDQIEIVKGNQEYGGCKNQHIYNEENICGTNNFMWDGFAVHFYFLYRIWMQKKYEAPCGLFCRESGSWIL